MGIVYLASLVVGLGVLVLQLAMGGKDADDGGDAHEKELAAEGGYVALLLSTRFWIFAALGFGLSGSLLHFLGLASAIATAITASGAGLGSGAFASAAFRAARRASISTSTSASEALGQVGRVLVACARGQVGQVRVVLKGQSVDFLATTDEDELVRGTHVLVEEVRGSVLHVSKPPPELA